MIDDDLAKKEHKLKLLCILSMHVSIYVCVCVHKCLSTLIGKFQWCLNGFDGGLFVRIWVNKKKIKIE